MASRFPGQGALGLLFSRVPGILPIVVLIAMPALAQDLPAGLRVVDSENGPAPGVPRIYLASFAAGGESLEFTETVPTGAAIDPASVTGYTISSEEGPGGEIELELLPQALGGFDISGRTLTFSGGDLRMFSYDLLGALPGGSFAGAAAVGGGPPVDTVQVAPDDLSEYLRDQVNPSFPGTDLGAGQPEDASVAAQAGELDAGEAFEVYLDNDICFGPGSVGPIEDTESIFCALPDCCGGENQVGTSQWPNFCSFVQLYAAGATSPTFYAYLGGYFAVQACDPTRIESRTATISFTNLDYHGRLQYRVLPPGGGMARAQIAILVRSWPIDNVQGDGTLEAITIVDDRTTILPYNCVQMDAPAFGPTNSVTLTLVEGRLYAAYIRTFAAAAGVLLGDAHTDLYDLDFSPNCDLPCDDDDDASTLFGVTWDEICIDFATNPQPRLHTDSTQLAIEPLPGVYPGATSSICLTVSNYGTQDAAGVPVEIYDDAPTGSTLIGSATVDVPRCESATVCFNKTWSVSEVGPRDIRGVVDPNNAIPESCDPVCSHTAVLPYVVYPPALRATVLDFDKSGSMNSEIIPGVSRLLLMKIAGHAYVEQNTALDAIAVFNFWNCSQGTVKSVRLQPADATGKAAAHAAVEAQGSAGATPLYDSLSEAIDEVCPVIAGAKAVIALSDGQNNCGTLQGPSGLQAVLVQSVTCLTPIIFLTPEGLWDDLVGILPDPFPGKFAENRKRLMDLALGSGGGLYDLPALPPRAGDCDLDEVGLSDDFDSGTFDPSKWILPGGESGTACPGDFRLEVVDDPANGGSSGRLFATAQASCAPYGVNALLETTSPIDSLTSICARLRFDQIGETSGVGHGWFQIGVFDPDAPGDMVRYTFALPGGTEVGDVPAAVTPGQTVVFSRELAADWYTKFSAGLPPRLGVQFRASADFAEGGTGARTVEVRIDDVFLGSNAIQPDAWDGLLEDVLGSIRGDGPGAGTIISPVGQPPLAIGAGPQNAGAVNVTFGEGADFLAGLESIRLLAPAGAAFAGPPVVEGTNIPTAPPILGAGGSVLTIPLMDPGSPGLLRFITVRDLLLDLDPAFDPGPAALAAAGDLLGGGELPLGRVTVGMATTDVAVLAIEPGSGESTGDTAVAISGLNFSGAPGGPASIATAELIGAAGVFALEQLLQMGDTMLTAVVPAGLPDGLYQVILTRSDGSRNLAGRQLFLAHPGGTRFTRGESNGDGTYDISDAVFTLACLFLGEACPSCDKAADSNDDGLLDISDPVHTLGCLFLGSECPPAPYPACGLDPTPDLLGCESFTDCP